MKIASYILVAFALIATVETFAAEWRQRSPRMATANVFSTNGTWNIAVSFVPVMAFEENKNLLENHRLAVTIAEWGLLKELHAAPSQMLETSGLQKTAFSVCQNVVNAEFIIPQEGVRLVERKAPVYKRNEGTVHRNHMPKWPDSVVSVEISNGEIEAILRKHPFFIKTGGAKILCLEDGRALIVSIGITDASKAPIARRTIAESKARAALVSQVNGVKVFTEKRLVDETITKVSEHGESAIELCGSTERIRSTSTGKIQGLGIIGTWIVKDENLFCLAVGRIIPASEVKQYITEIK